MVQQLIAWLPDQIGAAAVLIAICGAIIGATLWLAGAKFSTTLIGLATTSFGAAAGMAMPRYFGWSINGAAPAIAMAIVMGVSGFVLHRIWVGIGLGAVLAAWAALTSWASLCGDRQFVWPKYLATDNAVTYAHSIWAILPADVAHVLPYACGVAMLTGLVVTIFWPRLAIATAWSLAGVSMLVGLGAAAMEFSRPQWVNDIPREPSSQVLGLIALVAVGAAAQWRTARIAAGQPAIHSGNASITMMFTQPK